MHMLVTCCRILKTGRRLSVQLRMRIYHPSFESFRLKNERRKLKNDFPSDVRSANRSWTFPGSALTTSRKNKRKAKAEHKTVSTPQSLRPFANNSQKKESNSQF